MAGSPSASSCSTKGTPVSVIIGVSDGISWIAITSGSAVVSLTVRPLIIGPSAEMPLIIVCEDSDLGSVGVASTGDKVSAIKIIGEVL